MPDMSLLVIMAAVPPETGVGSMTPNWTLLAALDEAIYRQLGPNYELRVVPISSHLDGLLALVLLFLEVSYSHTLGMVETFILYGHESGFESGFESRDWPVDNDLR